MQSCIFCKIVAGEIPSQKVYEDENVIAFKDINPQAPVHVLVIPKKHFANLLAVAEANNHLLLHMHAVVRQLARELGVADQGFRLVINTGHDGGQTVEHLHFHLLGGRALGWPPG